MNITKLLITAGASLLLGACATTTPAERRAADDDRCRSYGFRPGTDAFAKCRLAIDLDRAAERRAQLDYPYAFGRRSVYWGRPW